MAYTALNHYGQVCLDASFNCQNLLKEFGEKTKSLSSRKAKLLDECAHVCMGTFHAIKNRSANAGLLAILCVGICEECADFCESFNNPLFKQCADACRYCSNNMSDLALAALS